MIEYSITIKNANFKIVEKDMLEEGFVLDRNNPKLSSMIQKAHEQFRKSVPQSDEAVDPPDITFKATLYL